MPETSFARLYVLRATYLLFFIAIPQTTSSSMVFSARGIGAGDGWGFASCLLTMLALMFALGLRYPLKMVPLLIFELGWKIIWLVRVALPLWLAGRVDDALRTNSFAIGSGMILLAVIPWRYVVRQYLRAPGDPWRTQRRARSLSVQA